MIPPASTQWIKKNMLGHYSEELGRPLTDAEVRVKRSLEQLQVPDWYKKYSKPTKFLKSSVAYDRRTPTWKTFKQRHANHNTPKNTPKKCAPKKTPRKVVRVSIEPVQCTPAKPIICGEQTKPDYSNEKYRIARKATLKRKSPTISITPSSSDTECESTAISPANVKSPSASSPKSFLNNSHTFPRVNPSRKIQNINIVFDKPFPSSETLEPPPLPRSAPPKEQSAATQQTTYTLTKKIVVKVNDDLDRSCSAINKSHTSFLFAEVEPDGIVNQIHGYAGLDSSYDIEENEIAEPMRSSPSPNTRFFNSSKKSCALEKIVQNGKSQSRDSGNRSLIQDIIEELDRSVAEGRSFLSNGGDDASAGTDGFVRSMIQALEDSYQSPVIVEDDKLSITDNCSDSELAKSTTISMYDSCDEPTVTTLPGTSCHVSSDEEDEDEEEIFWIPVANSIDNIQRASSRASIMSRNSNRSRCSSKTPALSPIKDNGSKLSADQRYWSTVSSYNQKKRSRPTSRRLFKIEEVGIIDSGYTTTNSSSSRTCTISPDGRSIGISSDVSSGTSSLSTSPTLMDCESMMKAAIFSRSDAYVYKSILV